MTVSDAADERFVAIVERALVRPEPTEFLRALMIFSREERWRRLQLMATLIAARKFVRKNVGRN
jgi:hypothetical protein